MLSVSQKEILHLHACLLLQYKHANEAVVLLKALILLDPEYLPAQYTMTLASLHSNQNEICINWCRKLLQNRKTKKKDALFLCLSRAYWRKGNKTKAKAAFDKYLILTKKNNNIVEPNKNSWVMNND